MKIKRSLLRKIIWYSVLLCGISLTIYSEVMARKICAQGFYEGTVVDKVQSAGRYSSSLFLVVDFRDLGVQTVLVSPQEYSLFEKGNVFQTQWYYSLLFGASGAAYVPKDDNRLLAMTSSIVRVLFLLYLSGLCIYFIIKFYFKISYEDKKNDSDSTTKDRTP